MKYYIYSYIIFFLSVVSLVSAPTPIYKIDENHDVKIDWLIDPISETINNITQTGGNTSAEIWAVVDNGTFLKTYTDTNASTGCSGVEVLLGNGSCYSSDNFGSDQNNSAQWNATLLTANDFKITKSGDAWAQLETLGINGNCAFRSYNETGDPVGQIVSRCGSGRTDYGTFDISNLIDNVLTTTFRIMADTGDVNITTGNLSVGSTTTAWNINTGNIRTMRGTLESPAVLIGDPNTGLYNPTATDDLAVVLGGSEIMRFDSSLSVGINTPSPSSKLEINNTGSGASLYIKHEDTSHPTNAIMAIGNADLSTQYFRVNQNGNVGFGTNSPQTLIHGYSDTSSAAETLESANSHVVLKLQPGYDNNYSYINLGNGSTFGWQLGKDIDSGVLGGANGFYIYEMTDGDQGTRFSINKGGDVGIGDTTPAKKLSVKAGASDGIELVDSSDNRVAILYQDADGDGALQINDKTATQVILLNSQSGGNSYINNGGNLGVGTATPAVRFTVTSAANSDASFTHTGDDGVFLRLASNRANTDDTVANIALRWNNTNIANILGKAGDDTTNKDEGDLAFLTTKSGVSGERMRITQEGYVGINEVSPDGIFHVTDSDLNVYFEETGQDNVNLILKSAETSSNGLLGVINSNWAGSQNVAQLRFWAGTDTTNKDEGWIGFQTANGGSPARRMVISKEGNVVIGNNQYLPSSPVGISRFLEIEGDTHAGIVLDDPRDEAWDIYNSNGGLYTKYNNAQFGWAMLKTTGYMGVNETTPLRTFEVAGPIVTTSGTSTSTGGFLRAYGGQFDVMGLNAQGGTYNEMVMRASSADTIVLQTDGDVVMLPVYSDTVGATNRDLYIDNTGKIGYVSSGERYKENIRDLSESDTSWIYDLRPRIYDRKDGSNYDEKGLIAEEVEEVNPKLVSYRMDEVVDEWEECVEISKNETSCMTESNVTYIQTDEPETVNYGSSELIVAMLKEIQRLKEHVDELEAIVNNLKMG